MKTARQLRDVLRRVRSRVRARSTAAQDMMDHSPAGSLALMRHLGTREAFDEVLEIIEEEMHRTSTAPTQTDDTKGKGQ